MENSDKDLKSTVENVDSNIEAPSKEEEKSLAKIFEELLAEKKKQNKRVGYALLFFCLAALIVIIRLFIL